MRSLVLSATRRGQGAAKSALPVASDDGDAAANRLGETGRGLSTTRHDFLCEEVSRSQMAERGLDVPFSCFFHVVHAVGDLHVFQGPDDFEAAEMSTFVGAGWALDSRRTQLRTWAVECVTAHLLGFEEDLGSEVVF